MAGSSTTRPSAIDSGAIKTLCDLTDVQIASLRDTYKIAHVSDLALLDKDDIDSILGNDASTFMKRRGLTAIAQYVKYGGTVTASTSMLDVSTSLTQISTGITQLASTSTSTRAVATSPAHAPIRLSSTDFPAFLVTLKIRSHSK